ncbi:tetratricopeptide repeat protein [Sorangium sp. So ce1078]|uniref:CHAT domain-containing tetratricopeptide repeat protein n=1 Tax=Sorangium sp. So ce1078 TaxID=3133329 RepID=UPI003F63B8C1
MALALLVGAPGGAHGQKAQPAAAALAEAERLNDEVLELHRQEKFEVAIPIAERALSLREQALGPKHPKVATSLNNLAALHKSAGSLARAEPLYQRALAIREEALGPEHPDVAISLNNLAEVYREKGSFALAEPLYQRALAIREKLGSEHPDVATSLNNLAMLYREKGDFRRAESMYERALAIKEKELGPHHPHVASVLGNLGSLHMTTGAWARAEPILQRALAISEKAFGPDHPQVAISLNNLAELHKNRGDYTRSAPLLQRAVSALEAAFGAEHPIVGISVGNLADLYQLQGDYARAEPLFLRALAIQEKASGADHPRVARALHRLASFSAKKGDYVGAERLLRRGLAILENALGPEHPEVAIYLDSLARLYSRKGDYASAEPVFERAIAITEKTLGPEHPDLSRALNSLALLHSRKGDYASAEPLMQRALAILEKALGPEHPDVAVSLNNLGTLYDAREDFRRAEPLFERALAITEKALGPEHPGVAVSLNNLGTLYDVQGDFRRAEPRLQRALAITEKALGPGHPDAADALNNLAVLYINKGSLADATPLLERALTIDEKAIGPESPGVAVSLGNLARLHLARGDIASAIQVSQRATAVDDRNATIVLTTNSDEQRRAYMATLRRRSHRTVSLHVQSAPSDAAAQRLALTTVLRRKGRVLDATADSLTALRRHLTPAHQALLDRLRSVGSQYSVLALRGPLHMALDDYRAAVTRLDKERLQLETEVSRQSAKLATALRSVTIDEVQAAIPEGAALVELFEYSPFRANAARYRDRWGAPRYVAYVLRRTGPIAWADLGESAPIEEAVSQLRGALGRESSDPRPAARALDVLIMQPIRRLLGETRWVMLSPDGALNLVPFEALVDEEGRYLVARYAFTYLTSGRDLVRLGRAAPSQQGAVVLAAPDFGAPSTPVAAGGERGQRSADMRAMTFAPLPSAAEEGRTVAGQLQGVRLLIGAGATETAIKAVRGPSVLHVATHGFFLPDQKPIEASPGGASMAGASGTAPSLGYVEDPLLRSGLALAGANARQSGGEDGVLTALEAAQLDLTGTRLVVLSACQTGVGEARSGEGVYGLRRALVVAGAETQVMSLWRVDDAATRELMEAYYARLRAGAGRSEAMREVQLAMLQRPERAHPYHWASFIVSGSGASLDGKAAAPDLARVPPGARGCGCEAAGRSPGGAGAWVAAVVALGRLRRRRRDAPLRRGEVGARW